MDKINERFEQMYHWHVENWMETLSYIQDHIESGRDVPEFLKIIVERETESIEKYLGKKELTLSIFEVVGSPLCVASSDGQKVYERLAAAMKEGRSVTISFHNIFTLTSAFLNAAIGQLYGEFDEEKIRALLKVREMQTDDMALLERVVETAKEYFTHRREASGGVHC